MRNLSLSEFDELARGSTALVTDNAGEGLVIQTPTGDIIKKMPFRKGLRARFFPRARRFRRNGRRLTRLGFQAVEVKDMYTFNDRNCHVIVYQKISGRSLAEFLEANKDAAVRREILLRVASYYEQLHSKGVYCRPTHFRNIIICPDGSFALIDVQNIRFRPVALDPWSRSTCFKNIFKYEIDARYVVEIGTNEFLETYMSHGKMGKLTRAIFLYGLRSNVPVLFTLSGVSP
jgi:hypothetical protein